MGREPESGRSSRTLHVRRTPAISAFFALTCLLLNGSVPARAFHWMLPVPGGMLLRIELALLQRAPNLSPQGSKFNGRLPTIRIHSAGRHIDVCSVDKGVKTGSKTTAHAMSYNSDGKELGEGTIVLGGTGTRAGYQIVKTLTLPSQLPKSDRDAARLKRAASLQAESRGHASIEMRSDDLLDDGAMSAAMALNLCCPEDFPTMTSARKAIRR